MIRLKKMLSLLIPNFANQVKLNNITTSLKLANFTDILELQKRAISLVLVITVRTGCAKI